VTDSTVEPEDFSGILAAHLHAEEAERQRNLRRAIASAAVVVLHVLLIILLIVSNRVAVVQRVRETVPEAIWILFPQPPKPKTKVEQPQPAEQETPQLTAPITNVPPTHTQPEAQPQSGDLEGVGRSLACGASSYEKLPPNMREQCRRHPWAFIKKPDGTIVLDAPKPDAIPSFSGADINRHQSQTAPPCPPLINVPCLSNVLPDRDPVTNGSLDGH
jgi:hypothetical protein